MSRWLHIAVVALLLFGSGCRCGSAIGGAAKGISLEPAAIDFGSVFIGRTKTAEVHVTNTGRASRSVSLAVEAPFAVDTEPFSLEGGASRTFTVTFSPDGPGEFQRTLVLESEGELSTSLTATALAPLQCLPKSDCWSSTFDLAQEKCVEAKLPNDTPCMSSGACLVGSRCFEGECVGSPRVCDDNDKCSADSCDSLSGCVHHSQIARCGASTDPCKVPACDPAVGCTFVDAADGTPCGPNDCSKAQICVAGLCKTSPSPEGSQCGNPSPCQPKGVCESNECVRPPPEPLEPLWTVFAQPGTWVQWDSIGDPVGNVYWRELSAGQWKLVSVRRDGTPRYAVPIPPMAQMMWMENRIVLRGGGRLEVRFASNGQLAWSRTLGLQPDGGSNVGLQTISRGTPNNFYIGANEANPTGQPRGSFVSRVDIATGVEVWTFRFPGWRLLNQTGPVDEIGQIYLGLAPLGQPDAGDRYVALSPLGQLRWDIDNPHDHPAAVFGGRVYHWDHWLSETVTGAFVNFKKPALGTNGYPRLALGAISYIGNDPRGLVPVCAPDGGETGELDAGYTMHLVRVDPSTADEMWSLKIVGADAGGVQNITNSVLTSTNSVIFSQMEHYCGPITQNVLREVSPQGEPGFICRLAGNEVPYWEGLLNDGKWIVAVHDLDAGRYGVRAYDMPGFEMPARGWATAWGSPARDNHSR